MDYAAFMNSDTFTFAILPLLIFLSRICDVTLDTVRIIYVQRGMKYVAPILGFFEVLIWLLAITQIMQHLTSPIHYIAYAAGFATGNLVGILVEEKLSVGTVLVRVITSKDTTKLLQCLKAEGYRNTKHEATEEQGTVNIIFSIVRRKDVKKVLDIIKICNPTAFYTVEDIRHAREEPIQTNAYTKRSLFDHMKSRIRNKK
ncbi:MAG: DUF2179 domain-containing protein [Candidatus Altiarchaeota archaeon]